jgi:aminotransferase
MEKPRLPSGSKKAALFTESVIREMTRLVGIHGGINLAQGFPDFPAPREIKDAAAEAIGRDINQYAITWGAKSFRDAISEKFERFYGMGVDPEREITVCCGSTEAMMSTLLAIVDPGDEVIVFEPFYENYGPDSILSGAIPRFVKLHEPEWHIDPDELAEAFNDRTRAIIINTPNNPTGKVFETDELSLIASLCQKWNAVALTDEIYEHIIYEGRKHVPIATLDGMRERTVTINSLSKTYSVTGWRVGYAIAPPVLTHAIRKVHDFLTVGAPAPLQEAGAAALRFPEEHYRDLADGYLERRNVLLEGLRTAGFECSIPYGAYYIMTDISKFGFYDDVQFARHLIEKIGVAGVPGSSFYHRPEEGSKKLRFTFCKRVQTLRDAAERLARLDTNR